LKRFPSSSAVDSVFESLPPSYREKVRSIFHVRRYRAGESIYLQGEQADAIYLVVEGRIKIERVTREGYQTILCVRGPGDIFCPVPILDEGPQLGAARAMTDVTLLCADRDSFQEACRECPEWLALVQRDCLLEMRRLLARLESSAFRSLRERLAFTILDESERQASYGESPDELRITQQELAGLVGASRESVSRTLVKLEQEGLVQTGRGRLTILNRGELRKLAHLEEE